MTAEDAVSYVSGRTRMFGIIGDPIEQVRSPEMVTAEMKQRGQDALLVPLHVLPADFDDVLPRLMKLANLGGLVFTIPYKVRAATLAASYGAALGPQARIVGAINALGRGADGKWRADIFDGLGCVEAFRRKGHAFKGKRVMLLGAGGAGAAIGVAIAYEGPAAIRLFDVDAGRAAALVAKIRSVDAGIAAEAGAPTVDGVDYLINATPVGMLTDVRLPLPVESLPARLVVLDAIVKPERTPLLALAERCGCPTIGGREMMRGQIATMVDFFGYKRAGA
ncbi:MAG: shikimate dehydrogenase [Alphaproteobacteria bacterium]|nr:shikimate dehydrogenase [Alphaproteobacteria bacterium]